MKGERFINLARRFVRKPIQKRLKFLRHSFGNYLNARKFSRECAVQLAGRKIDMCLCHDVFALPAGRDIARQNKAILVADLVEIPFVRQRSGRYFRETPRFGAWLQNRQHHKGVRAADFVLTIGDAMAGTIENALGVCVRPLRNCHDDNGVDGQGSVLDIPGITAETKVLCYVNGFGDGYGLETAILALLDLPPHVHLLCIGSFADAAYKAEVENLVAEKDLGERVHFLPARAQSDFITLLSTADLGLLMLDPDIDNMRLSLPNRFFDFLKAGLPIISTEVEDVARYIKAHEIGFVAKSNDPKELARLVDQALKKHVAQRLKRNVLAAQYNFIWAREVLVLDEIVGAMEGSRKNVCILAHKQIAQNNRIVKMARFLASKNCSVTVISLGNPLQEQQDKAPGCSFIEVLHR
ncbi:MAG: glycosyltransferase family 4 protein [Rhodobacterales bacterium]